MLVMAFALFIEPEKQSQHTFWFVLLVVFIALICGLRDMLGGYDNYIYGQVFDLTATDIKKGIPFFSSFAFGWVEKEKGYAFYNAVIALITVNRYLFMLLTSLLVYAAFFRHLRAYSAYPFLALFILFCLFYFFTFTYLRQVLAVSIAWFAIPYAIRRKPVPFFAIVLLAYTFHNSVILFSVVYFVSNRRFTLKQIYTFFVIGLILGFTPIGSGLMEIIGGAINPVKTNLSISQVHDARWAYIGEAAFFLFLISLMYDKIPDDPLTTCMLNIALLFVFTLLFFVRFTDGGRLGWCFLIGIACTVAQICAQDTSGGIRIGTAIVMILLYVRVLLAWGGQLSPYKTFLRDGVRKGDVIWQKNEYDHRYDNDKLYKI